MTTPTMKGDNIKAKFNLLLLMEFLESCKIPNKLAIIDMINAGIMTRNLEKKTKSPPRSVLKKTRKMKSVTLIEIGGTYFNLSILIIILNNILVRTI